MDELFQHIFNLPLTCVFHTVVPKRAFEKHNQLAAAEKRLVAISFLPLQSVLKASLVQSKSFIPAAKDEQMDYEDILFFSLKLKSEHLDKYSDKLIQLYQKYIPKPCMLLLYDDTRFMVNTALKKYNEVDNKKRIVTEQLTTPVLSFTGIDDRERQLVESLNFNRLDKQNLKMLHRSYAHAIINFNIGMATGSFGKTEDVGEDAQKLREITLIEKELDALRNHIRKSRRLDEQIAYKIQLKEKKNTLQKIKDSL